MSDKQSCIQYLTELIEQHMETRGGLPVHGLSVLPVHNSKTVLGRENEGMNKGLFHAFGGSSAKRNDAVGADAVKLAVVCYEEVQEELGLCLTAAAVKKCFCGVFWVPFEDSKIGMTKTTLVMVLNLGDISCDDWVTEYNNRFESFEKSGLERRAWWKWCEMDKVEEFSLDESLTGNELVSSFMQENWQTVLKVYEEKKETTEFVSARDLKWAKPRAAEGGVVLSEVEADECV